jgi:hypothetical protein
VASCLGRPYSEKTMSNAKVSLACLSACVALVAPATASAQIDPGVNYDSGSPAGKEYAIPLVEGRSEGAGTEDQQAGANVPFGVGITPPGGGDGQKAGAKQGQRGKRARAERSDSPQGARPGETGEELNARIAEAETPSGTAARTFLLALAVLLPAALLALLLRDRGQVSRTGRAA